MSLARWSLLLVLAGCGGTRPGAGLPASGGPPTEEAPAQALPAPGRFFTPGLADYAGAERLPADALETRLRQALQQSIEPPASLDCLAREYAGRFAADARDADPGAIQAMATRCGYWSRPAHVTAATALSEDALLAHFGKIPLQAVPGPLGVGVARHPDGRVTGVLVIPPGELRLEPIARKPSGSAVLRGRLLRGDGALEVWVDDGKPRALPVKADPAGRFEVALPAVAPDGALQVEVVRHTGRFRRTMALLTLGVGRQDGYAARPLAAVGRPAATALVTAVNQARLAAGRPPLQPEPALHAQLDAWMDRLAQGEASDEPPGIVDERGWPFAAVGYGFTEGADPGQAIDLLLETPTGRDVLLGANLDEVAVGTRPFEAGPGFDAVILGLQRFQGRPAEEVRATLQQKLTAARGGQALTAAPALQAIAQAVADRALAGSLPWKDAVPAVMEVVRAEKPVRGNFGAGAFTVVNPAEADTAGMPHALDPGMKFIGIGVAAGPLPGGGIPRHIIVYLAAEALPGDG
ncbi:MAG: hypothetical protein H6706_09405 [Myxococcales bacterium]|nr:hypothetical protein [Myxococcales bacterium]